jgi:hypoxanthine phosphoribosyltransferase
MPDDPSLEILFTRRQIQARVEELGAAITADYARQNLLLVGVLKGAVPFLADLARCIDLDCAFGFVAASSYGKSVRTSGRVHLKKDLDADVAGQHVLLVDDILDTGITLSFLRQHVQERQPASVKIAVLLDKPSRRLQSLEADFVGFTIPDRFVVGYGMDYSEKFRNLPDICAFSADFQG